MQEKTPYADEIAIGPRVHANLFLINLVHGVTKNGSVALNKMGVRASALLRSACSRSHPAQNWSPTNKKGRQTHIPIIVAPYAHFTSCSKVLRNGRVTQLQYQPKKIHKIIILYILCLIL
jgi:hypothetical protein